MSYYKKWFTCINCGGKQYKGKNSNYCNYCGKSLRYEEKESEMKTKQVIESCVGEVDFDNLLFVDEENGWFANEDYEDAGEKFECSPELLKAIDKAIQYGLEKLQEALMQDLKDIWERL